MSEKNNTEIPNFKIWYNDACGQVITYDYETTEFEEIEIPPTNCNSFFLPKLYQIKKKHRKEITPDEYQIFLKKQAVKYASDLVFNRKEVLDSKSLKFKFDYFDNTLKLTKHNNATYFRSHGRNVKTFFKRLCMKGKDYIYKDYDDVKYDEYMWFKSCGNSGLIYLKEAGKYTNMHGYDFKMSYPTDMASIEFQMPTKQGKEGLLLKLPSEYKYIRFGIYRVEISCNNPDFPKVFQSNKNNYYTSYSLKFAIMLQKHFLITIKLIFDGEANAYLYNKEDLVSGNKIFANWFYRLKELKAELPNNGLIKSLASSGWGHLNECKIKYIMEDEVLQMIENGSKISTIGKNLDYIIVDMTVRNDGNTQYALINSNEKVYDLPLRLLPFITSFSRVKMGKVIHRYKLYDNVIRIQTDSIIFDKALIVDVPGFITDEKISGTIKFENVNNYEKV